MPGIFIFLCIVFGIFAVAMNIRWYQKYRDADPDTRARMRLQMRRRRQWQNQQNLINQQMMDPPP